MRFRTLAVLPVIGVLAVAGRAHAATFNFGLGGDGNVTASGTLTIGPDPYANSTFGTPANLQQVSPLDMPPSWQGLYDPLNAQAITGVTGTFSDAKLGISDVAITGLIATNPEPHFDEDLTIPHSFGWYPAPGVISYDNLFYVNGSPQTCTVPPPGNYGGFFDNYGVMFSLANGDVVDLYSNGDITAAGNPPVTPGPNFYGVVVGYTDPVNGFTPDYTSAGGLIFNIPEPSTWAMMMLGFASLGFAGYRASQKTATAAA
jgi:PEP-CTERM motif